MTGAPRPDLGFRTHLGIPHPRWYRFFEKLTDAPDVGTADEWLGDAVRDWVVSWRDAILTAEGEASDEAFGVYESSGVLVLAGSRAERIMKCAHETLRTLDGFLGIDADPEGRQPWLRVLVEAPSPERFVDLLDAIYEASRASADEGDSPDRILRGDSSMFVRTGYPFILLAPGNEWGLAGTIAHELTHAHLSRLSLPLWLEEGITQLVQERIGGTPLLTLDAERKAEHLAHWDPTTIQDFWTGETFESADDDCGLAYEMALVMVKHCLDAHGDDAVALVHEAQWQDAGASACEAALGRTAGSLVTEFLGEGDWEPDLEPLPGSVE